MTIKLVTQGDKDCVLACIAMASGLSLDDVREAYPEFDGTGINTMETIKIIERLKIPYVWQINAHIYEQRVYILTVPSLNFPGGNHSIVVSYDNDVPSVYDSNNGYEGRKFYKDWNDVKSWADVIEIIR